MTQVDYEVRDLIRALNLNELDVRELEVLNEDGTFVNAPTDEEDEDEDDTED